MSRRLQRAALDSVTSIFLPWWTNWQSRFSQKEECSRFDSEPGYQSKRKNHMKKIDLDEVRQFIESQTPETRIYLGCDSERLRVNGVWHADYVLAIVVHINGNNGCKLFGEVHRERVWDAKVSKPSMRLMTEVYKVSELYLKLAEVLEGRHVEVHLDINPNEMHGSSCVISQAIGYIKGTCNVVPFVKPEAFAASYAADRFKGLRVA
jgi:predicted RNase H-related nuclease YkuK (DUF458 family)